MKRLVIMIFSDDAVCFPSEVPRRVTSALSTASAPRAAGDPRRAEMVAHVTRFLADRAVTVEDVEEADGDRCFAMIMIGRVVPAEMNLSALRTALSRLGQSLGVTIRVQREDLFLAMHRI